MHAIWAVGLAELPQWSAPLHPVVDYFTSDDRVGLAFLIVVLGSSLMVAFAAYQRFARGGHHGVQTATNTVRLPEQSSVFDWSAREKEFQGSTPDPLSLAHTRSKWLLGALALSVSTGAYVWALSTLAAQSGLLSEQLHRTAVLYGFLTFSTANAWLARSWGLAFLLNWPGFLVRAEFRQEPGFLRAKGWLGSSPVIEPEIDLTLHDESRQETSVVSR